MKGEIGLTSVFERFFAFERDAALFGREVCGVRFWHYIRFHVYTAVVLPYFVPMSAAHPDMQKGRAAPRRRGFAGRIWGWVRGAWSALRLQVFGNPAFAVRRRRVLIALAPRTTRLPDGRRVRLAVDFFVGRLRSSWCVLEAPVAGSGYAVHDGGGRVFVWEAAKAAMDRYRRSPECAAAAPEISAAAGALADAITSALGVPVDAETVRKRIASAVALERAAVPLLRKWLRRLGVGVVAEAVSYSGANMALTSAAHAEGIPVVELQHGTVYPAHVAYNLPVADSPYTPDYLLGWGDWWLRQTRNFPSKRAVAAGYPYLDYFLKSFPRRAVRGGKTRVLFISQGTVGRELADAAVRLSGALPEDGFHVAFKLHPSETKRWRELYPCLLASRVAVVENSAKSVYECFAESDATVGACSTALIEGFAWGLPAFIFKGLAGADTMAPFCDGVRARYVGSVEELADALAAANGPSGREAVSGRVADFFQPDAAAAISERIDGIVCTRCKDLL